MSKKKKKKTEEKPKKTAGRTKSPPVPVTFTDARSLFKFLRKGDIPKGTTWTVDGDDILFTAPLSKAQKEEYPGHDNGDGRSTLLSVDFTEVVRLLLKEADFRVKEAK